MKIAGRIEKIRETCTDSKIMPADFYEEAPRAFGHIIPHFRKSQQFLRISFSFLFSLFATAHEGKNSSQKNKLYGQGYASDARRCDVAYSTHDYKPSASKQS